MKNTKDENDETLRLIFEIQQGADKFPELWLKLLPWTKRICAKYIKREKGDVYYDMGDLINCSYFALRRAVFGCDRIKEYMDDPFGIFRFMKYYCYFIKSETRKDRKMYRAQDRDTIIDSLNRAISFESESEKLDFIEDERAIEKIEAVIHKIYLEQLREAFSKYDTILTDIEKDVIKKLFYEKKTHREAAIELNCSDGFVKETERRAFRKYRKPLDGIDLHEFLLGVY